MTPYSLVEVHRRLEELAAPLKMENRTFPEGSLMALLTLGVMIP